MSGRGLSAIAAALPVLVSTVAVYTLLPLLFRTFRADRENHSGTRVMLWSWPATIASLVGLFSGTLWYGAFCAILAFRYPQGIDEWLLIPVGISMLLVSVVSAILTYARISRGGDLSVNETHCRKCDYILRGISEPRCPECGERI